MLNDQSIDQELATQVVPQAVELDDEQLDAVFGGRYGCGCGWICSFTGECGCPNGISVCFPCIAQ